LIEIRNTN